MVKCADCGFLVVRYITDEVYIAQGSEQRETGEPPGVMKECSVGRFYAKSHYIETKPRCAIGIHRISEEYENEKPAGIQDFQKEAYETAKAVIHKERECERFTNWLPALTAKDHLEMMNAQEQSLRDRQWRREDRNFLAVVGIAGALLGAFITAFAGKIYSVSGHSPPPAVSSPAETPVANLPAEGED